HAAAPAVLATRATAAVAINDLVAFGLLAGLNEAGGAVPADVSVVGFDDNAPSRYATPAPTDVAVREAALRRDRRRELPPRLDDIALSRYATPALTTVAVPQAELGRHAWRELHAVIDDDAHPARSARFTPSLEVRGSTGPVPQGPERVHVTDDGTPADRPEPAPVVPAVTTAPAWHL